MNYKEILRRATKYIMMFFIIVITLNYIPKIKLTNQEIFIIGVIASIAFSMIDMYSPTISK